MIARTGRDVGSGSVLALAVLAAVMAGAVVVASLGAASSARAAAQSAADLAALAGAARSRIDAAMDIVDPGGPCHTAAVVASRNGAALVTCDVAADASVTVEVSARRGPWTVSRAARAGPAW